MANFKIQYSPESLEEIEQAISYYKSISLKLGGLFKRNVLNEIKLLKLHPTYNSFRYDEVRFAVIKKFPYAFHYTTDNINRVVKIQALLSFSQNPDTNWKLRI
jgi:hypothetical protein